MIWGVFPLFLVQHPCFKKNNLFTRDYLEKKTMGLMDFQKKRQSTNTFSREIFQEDGPQDLVVSDLFIFLFFCLN